MVCNCSHSSPVLALINRQKPAIQLKHNAVDSGGIHSAHLQILPATALLHFPQQLFVQFTTIPVPVIATRSIDDLSEVEVHVVPEAVGGGDVTFENDFRSAYAQVIDNWLGASSVSLLGGIFLNSFAT